MRGPDFSLHPSEEAGRWQNGLLVHLHLYSNGGTFGMPDVSESNGLRASLNSTYISPEILEESGGRKAKGVRSLFFVVFCYRSYKNTREACKRELRLQKIRRGYWMFLKEGDDLAP